MDLIEAECCQLGIDTHIASEPGLYSLKKIRKLRLERLLYLKKLERRVQEIISLRHKHGSLQEKWNTKERELGVVPNRNRTSVLQDVSTTPNWLGSPTNISYSGEKKGKVDIIPANDDDIWEKLRQMGLSDLTIFAEVCSIVQRLQQNAQHEKQVFHHPPSPLSQHNPQQ